MREEKAKAEMVYYKNELKNREANYNSIFGGRAKQSVGLVNVVNNSNTKRPSSALSGKENSKMTNLRSKQRSSSTKQRLSSKISKYK